MIPGKMVSNAKCVFFVVCATITLASISSVNAYQKSSGSQCSRTLNRNNLHLRGGASKKKNAEDDKYKDIQAPKRALSAYMLYANEVRADIVKKNPEMKMTEISKVIGDKWKVLSADGKKKFENEAAKLKSEYEKEKAEYEAKVPEEVRKERTEKAKKKKEGKPAKDPNAPKRPLSAFMIYSNQAISHQVRDKIKSANPELTFAEMGKKVYEKEAAKLKEKYAEERAKYDADKPEAPVKEKTLKKSKTSSSKSAKPEKPEKASKKAKSQ
ncbi:hypothetical protein GUITHDRAFT_161135 [Guillardia theta CCMP2712]|uniref:HMG box domain-containing protein n=1 Tax=Guillardia theta (strain CCMP2712) TaxID=905079 RepID=L1JXD5_GUITC|nr:hypothetical protein GUITHDRAFT_161135 [Guillardia theta CCMP2712]EKX52999.1 hypothetical protein GUITHDRAFT_161135 [Guillardia theta CCMP2712]|eukprot:XP_005839979.1 hypothetical protein GUITHDRAFT_161135 [Guillardia theta CCMP2712]